MGCQVSVTTNYLQRTTRLPQPPYVIMAWVRPTTTDTNNNVCIVDYGGAGEINVQFSGLSNLIFNGWGSFTFGAYTANTWYHLATLYKFKGVNGGEAYVNGWKRGSFDTSNLTTAGFVRLMRFNSRCDVEEAKIFDRWLSAEEIWMEAWASGLVSNRDVNSYYPLTNPSAAAIDVARLNNMTVTGTISQGVASPARYGKMYSPVGVVNVGGFVPYQPEYQRGPILAQ